MTQPISPRPDLVDTPWQGCPGLRAGAVDGAAALIVMEVVLDALVRMPQGRAALAEARGRRVGMLSIAGFEGSPTERAADALAGVLLEAADALDEDPRFAA